MASESKLLGTFSRRDRQFQMMFKHEYEWCSYRCYETRSLKIHFWSHDDLSWPSSSVIDQVYGWWFPFSVHLFLLDIRVSLRVVIEKNNQFLAAHICARVLCNSKKRKRVDFFFSTIVIEMNLQKKRFLSQASMTWERWITRLKSHQGLVTMTAVLPGWVLTSLPWFGFLSPPSPSSSSKSSAAEEPDFLDNEMVEHIDMTAKAAPLGFF